MATYKYIRVSTNHQDIKRQEIIMENIKADKVYIDKLTGKNMQRPQLNQLRLDTVEKDNIYIESISRLGRNVDDLRYLCEEFKNKGATVHFIKDGLNTNGDTYKFLLTILGAVAEMERETIVTNVRDGVKKAQKYGTKSGRPIGRPLRSIPKNFEKYYLKWKEGEITATEFAKLMEMSRSTLYRYIKLYEKDYEIKIDNYGKKYIQYRI